MLEIALVFGAVWYGLAFLAGDFDSKKNDSFVATDNISNESILLTGFADNTDKVEIPAVSAGDSFERNRPRESRALEVSPNTGVYNADWLLVQNSGSYVVQLASSTDKTDLFQKAFEFSDDYPVVVYPFKKTRTNRTMYGVSVGVYKSYNEAYASVVQLTGNAVADGFWIRPVKEIQKQIGSVR